jgi:membrane protein required for beta-lactamase induction
MPRASDIEVVEDAIFVQSNNRIFGVMFWFVVLGPVGAWIFRVSDLLRRRAVFEHMRGGRASEATLVAIEAIYGLLKWIPARLAMLGYAMGGSFDDAMNAWRAALVTHGMAIDQRNDLLIARVGKAAMTGYLSEPANSSAAARNSMRIVRRTVFIWVSVIAVMTLFGWAL